MNGALRDQLLALWPIIRKYKWSFLNLFICVVFTSVIGMAYPYIFGLLVDEVFYHRNFRFLVYIVTAYGLVFAGEQCLHICFNSVWAYLATRFSFDIRKKLHDKLFSLQSVFFTTSKSGDLMAVINRDTDEVMSFIHLNVFFLTANIIRLATAVAFVLYANIYLGLLMLLAIPAAVFTAMAFGQALKARMEEQREQYGDWMSWCLERIAGLRDIRLLGASKYSTRVFVQMMIQYMRTRSRSSKMEWISERTVKVISLGSDLALYATASYLIVHQHITIGVFIATIEYFSKGGELLQKISGASRSIQRNKVAISRVFSLLQEKGEEMNVGAPSLAVTEGEIEFRSVSFRYSPEIPVLLGISFFIEGGTTVAVVGRSGGGKSTLISLLLGLYKADEGDILIDGVSIADCNLHSLRKSIGVVSQETFLFEGSLRENLLWGSPYQPDEALWLACEKAFIAEYVRGLPDGLSTRIGGEHGSSMSGGQRQRIALARVFLRKPRILVFDEATSALDGEAEKAIRFSWQALGEQVTTIIIAHRLSTIVHADKVAVINQGRIAAYDHHEKLLAESDAYRQLFDEQYSESGLGVRNEAITT